MIDGLELSTEVLVASVGTLSAFFGAVLTYLGVRNSNKVKLEELRLRHSLDMQVQHVELARSRVDEVHIPLAAALARLNLGIESAKSSPSTDNAGDVPQEKIDTAKQTIRSFLDYADEFYEAGFDIYLLEPTSLSLARLVSFLRGSLIARKPEREVSVSMRMPFVGEFSINPKNSASQSFSFDTGFGGRVSYGLTTVAAPILSEEFSNEISTMIVEVKKTVRSVVLGVTQ